MQLLAAMASGIASGVSGIFTSGAAGAGAGAGAAGAAGAGAAGAAGAGAGAGAAGAAGADGGAGLGAAAAPAAAAAAPAAASAPAAAQGAAQGAQAAGGAGGAAGAGGGANAGSLFQQARELASSQVAGPAPEQPAESAFGRAAQTAGRVLDRRGEIPPIVEAPQPATQTPAQPQQSGASAALQQRATQAPPEMRQAAFAALTDPEAFLRFDPGAVGSSVAAPRSRGVFV